MTWSIEDQRELDHHISLWPNGYGLCSECALPIYHEGPHDYDVLAPHVWLDGIDSLHEAERFGFTGVEATVNANGFRRFFDEGTLTGDLAKAFWVEVEGAEAFNRARREKYAEGKEW